MKNINIIKKLNTFEFEPWLKRPFGAFMMSYFQDGTSKKAFEKLGLKNTELQIMLFQRGEWYKNDASIKKLSREIERNLGKISIFNITQKLELHQKTSKRRITYLLTSKKETSKKKMQEVLSILTTCTTFLWLTHGLEEYYTTKAKKEVPKYISSDVDKFIGDASLPKKMNIHSLMEDEIRRGIKAEIIYKKYAWLRVRDSFNEPFTLDEIKSMIQEIKLKKIIQAKKVNVPKQLKKLISELQELVYFRTARTDVLYELLYLARPILQKGAEQYSIPFKDLKNYTIHSIIAGKPQSYTSDFCFGYYKGSYIYTNDWIVKPKEVIITTEVKGMTAFSGITKGIAKIVYDVSQLEKVKRDDILVTQMTVPSFIGAMYKASAFVTDEGGITCHAAIVAREMKKPCVIGTKIATKVFKDGDLIEVNANTGIVRKI